MKIITMATLKGGTGKTLNTFNISGILAEINKILLIDVDPQCNLSSNCGIDTSNFGIKSVKDIFENLPKNQPTAQEVILKAPIPELPNLDLIPSSILLFKTEKAMSMKNNREHILEYFINNNREYLQKYDYIILDTNPSMSIVNTNAFYIADSIILSSDISTNSISGAELFCALWEDDREELYKEDNVGALILCNVDRRSNLGDELWTYTKSDLYSIPNELIVNTVIPMTVKLKNTEIEHRPVNLLYPKSNIRKIYDSVIKELKDKGVL
jgi:chromosome partitioning protein